MKAKTQIITGLSAVYVFMMVLYFVINDPYVSQVIYGVAPYFMGLAAGCHHWRKES